MKKLFFIVSAILLTYGSCKEIDKLTHFNMDYTSNITVESTFFVDVPFDIWTPDIPTNSETTFENNDTRTDLIEEIILTQMNMNITSPDSQTFDFLKTIEVYIDADGLDEKKIAWLLDIPQTGLKEIILEISDDDLKDYIKKDKYKLRSHTVTRQLISKSTDIEIKSSFFVDASILGI